MTAIEETDPAEEERGIVVPLDPSAASEIVPTPEATPARVLVVVAHPDDCDFGAAGTIALWTSLGAEVTYCIVTDGSAGAADPSVDLEQLATIRQKEQRAAARAVGVDEVVFLGYKDGLLEPSQEVRRDISQVIRQVRPDRVITQSPERNYERIRASHPDHLAAGEATLRAVYPDARNPYAHPDLLAEGWQPFEVPEVWLMAAPQSGMAVDITETFDKKIAALTEHRSQITDPGSMAGFVREWCEATARAHGLGAGRLAESFQVVDTR